MPAIREYFFISFSEPQLLGPQSSAPAEHFTFLGYIRENPAVGHRFTLAEHLERAALKPLELPGTKLLKLGRYLVTLLADPEAELQRARNELLGALLEDGYICNRPEFYGDRSKPHVTMGIFSPRGRQPKKLAFFAFKELTLTESSFDSNYTFLGAQVLHTRSFG
jgi:hypothetical protein